VRTNQSSRPLGAIFQRLRGIRLAALAAAAVCGIGGLAVADVPLRALPSGAVPNPGTQQQELTNITAPADFNVFEFVVTCAGCHGGSIDQHAGHFANWAGTSMASAARDPVFRANQIGVNNVVKSITGQDGAGNVCFRCHSPNGWLSGRFDPTLGGKGDGSNLINSILLSTDAEGISCETCHRAVGNVTNKRADLDPTDSVWKLLGGIFDWPHEGREATDQDNDPTIGVGLPYGDTSLQFLDGIAYVGKYSGTGDVYFSDLPLTGTYTGQIYAVYPDWWVNANQTDPSGFPIEPVPAGQPATNSAGQTLAYAPDGTLPPLFEAPVGPPTSLGGVPKFSMQSLSVEHPTVGGSGRQNSRLTPPSLLPALPAGPGNTASPNEFIRTSEFCGTCHDLTVPILNHGMPEQRTFSEWKFSAYAKNTNVIDDPLGKRTGTGVERCQDCHMPTLKHEYSDANAGSLNADPVLAGGFPYGKDRGPQGGTAFHKLTGANRDLPMMMKALYPEVDLEVFGAPAGKDPRVFPGMLTDRGPMYDRAQRNTEITLRDGVDVQVTQSPTEVVAESGIYEMKVKVTNKSGHRIPSGYPDGRRFWLEVNIKDNAGNPVYQSGHYDAAQAALMTDGTTAFNRALTNLIDATTANAVMVYERVTGICTDGTGAAIFPDPTARTPAACSESPALTNNFILFDNRIPPKGLDYNAARLAGVKLWNHDPVTKVPYEDSGRYTADQLAGGYDEVTYRFSATPGLTSLSATVDAYWQTHTREFMEHLRDQDSSTVRPQGPPNPFAIGYPFTPNYLSESINGKPLTAIPDPFQPAVALNDNWGGVAYAAWLETGKGAPYLVDRDDTAVTDAPAAPTGVTVAPTGEIDPVTLAPDIFAARISWDTVPGADGYTIWVRYGKSDTTADWDRLAVVDGSTTSFVEHVFNPGKTYGFKVAAFNGGSLGFPVAISRNIINKILCIVKIY
jgi:mono/diheme cytochrome c family protein